MSALNILLVDDDQNLVTTLACGLQKAMGEAISVSVCFSGSEALSMLALRPFDLVISDFHLPGMTGLELLKTIRRDHCATTLVLITADGKEELEKEAHHLRIGYIAKPFELPLLVQSIRGVIWGREAGQKAEPTPRVPEMDVPHGDLLRGTIMDRGDSNG